MDKKELMVVANEILKQVQAGKEVNIDGVVECEGDYVIEKEFAGRILNTQIKEAFDAFKYYESKRVNPAIWLHIDEDGLRAYANIHTYCKHPCYDDDVDIEVLRINF